MSELGRREDALTAIEEAVDFYRALATYRALSAVFTLGLVGSVTNLLVQLAGLGRREDALTAAEEAVRTYHALARPVPTFTCLLSLGARSSTAAS